MKAYTKEVEKLANVEASVEDEKTMTEEQLITANLKYVFSIAKQYSACSVDFDDLIQEGNMGLVVAARKFDPNKGIKFIGYAQFWIKKFICQAIHKKVYLMRGSVGKEFEVVSMQTKLKADSTTTIENMIKNTNADSMMDAYMKSDEYGVAVKLTKKLSEKEQAVITLRYGLGEEEPMTLKEVAKVLGRSIPGVRKIEMDALRKMRAMAK